MGNFRTSSVFKFTKDFELLKKILRDGIIPNYCEEDLSFDKTEFVGVRGQPGVGFGRSERLFAALAPQIGRHTRVVVARPRESAV